MKTSALFLSGLLLSALAAGPVAAEPVRVKLTARVSEVSDPGNLLAGRVVVGQRVNGTYVYNTDTPNQSQFPGSGQYQPYANQARIRFAVGSHVFESAQPTQGILIEVHPGNGGNGQFVMASFDNKPLASGASVVAMSLEFHGSGNVTQSEALPNVAPILDGYWTKEVMITGHAFGNGFMLRAQIEVAELIVPDAITVSPASGRFVANQHFDAAVILPRNSTVSNAHALANGVLLPLTYPGVCQLQAHNSASNPYLLCPGAEAALDIAAGAPIEWIVELTNGTVLTETVNWTLAE